LGRGNREGVFPVNQKIPLNAQDMVPDDLLVVPDHHRQLMDIYLAALR
jgi:hypothetical protein